MKFEPEQVDAYHTRTKVIGGWLVETFGYEEYFDDGRQKISNIVASSFVPDPHHNWKIDK